MPIAIEVHIADPYGTQLAIVANFSDSPDGAGLEYALNVGKIGALTLTLPAPFDTSLLRLDGRIGVWRSINGRTPKLDGDAIYLIRQWTYTRTHTIVTAVHATDLLRRRIIAYAAGSAYADKSAAAAGDQIKAFASENMGSGIVSADRDGVETQANLSAYLAIQAALGDGASLAKACSRRNLFDVISEINQASLEAGTYLTAEIVAPTESTLELRTYAGQRGIDHTADSGQPVILSEEQGTLANATLTVDHTDEATFAIVAGANTGAARITATAVDTVRMGASPFNRIERFGDFPNLITTAALQAEANALLREGRPKISVTADLVETDGATRGIHYDLGDIVTAEVRGKQYDVRLDVVSVSVRAGTITSQVQLRTDT